MQVFDFPAKNHLSPSDQARLARLAEANGQTPEEFVESIIKRELFAQPFPLLGSSPTPSPETEEDPGTEGGGE